MTEQPPFLTYKRSRFSTRLPSSFAYTASHCWLESREQGVKRVGFTKFATRMLGELVETGIEIGPGEKVAVGDIIGWVECLKAASDLYCVAEGEFLRLNPDLNSHPEWLQKDPYARGWVYEVRGRAEPNAVDASGYAAVLDATIDKMLGENS